MTQQAYSIKVNKATKTMEMMVSGTFTPQDYENFVKDYIASTTSINATEYKLEVDCRQMALLRQEEVEKLKASFTRYKESGFQQVILIITQAQLVNKMQLARVAREAGLSNVEIIVQ